MREQISIKIQDVNVFYGHKQVLNNINMNINKNSITAFIGPSGCGKTTMLRSLNRMNDFITSFKITGNITIDDENIYSFNKAEELIRLRRKVGLVFQQPNPFKTSIYENLKMPVVEKDPKVSKTDLNNIIEKCLKDTHIYDEIHDRLFKNAESLSGGQQQRLCIARALTIDPEIILFDEPCSALDPISTSKIEDLLLELKNQYTVIIVTHNLQQASRIADYVGFFYQGDLVEFNESNEIFINPKKELTEKYLSGVFS